MATDGTGSTASNPVLPYEQQFRQLKQAREEWEPLWRDSQKNLYANKGMYLDNPDEVPDDGERRDLDIMNNTPTQALDNLAAGMQGGLTSASRPWIKFGLTDTELESDAVTEYLQASRDVVLDIFARSNFYGSMHNIYEEGGAFGTAVMLIERDLETAIRCTTFTIGEFWLALDRRYRPTTLYRRYEMSARNLAAEFGVGNLPKNIADASKNNNASETSYKVIHCIRPRDNRDPGKVDAANMLFESVQWIEKGHDGKFLRKSGYRGLPFMAHRWYTRGSAAVYGRGPGINALGDCKELQAMESDKSKAHAKKLDPPMKGDASLEKSGGGNIKAGGMNYGDMQNGNALIVPVYQIDIDFQNTAFELDRLENRIKTTFHNNLFLSIISADKDMTAEEVRERTAERAMLMGPVIDGINENLSTAIDRTLQIADELNLLPPAPPEIAGKEIKIEYISILAQAQKSQGLRSITNTLEFVANSSQLYPSTADTINPDKLVDEFTKLNQTPAIIMNDEQERKAIRDARAEKAAAAERLAASQQMAETAKTMSETSTDPDSQSALTSVAEAAQQGAA